MSRVDSEVRVSTAPAGGPRRKGAGGGRRRGDPNATVPDADFKSYYGRQIVKPSPWEADIPAYLFLGGLAAGSSLLGAGATLTGRDATARAARVTALGSITVSFAALVHDLGRPSRFVNMMRVIKPTSPMSVGTWILSAYAPFCALAGGTALLGDRVRKVPVVGSLLPKMGDASSGIAALVAPAVASYTAVLLADTATPTWHEAWPELPIVFVASAAAAAGGAGLIAGPLWENGPAARMAVMGAVTELVTVHRMESRMGLVGEPLSQGRPGMLMKAARALTAAGAVGALVGARRSRTVAALSGAALVAGSVCTRFGVFHAGQESAKDPRYTVVPQRERLEAKGAV